jgi:hypothetical protein
MLETQNCIIMGGKMSVVEKYVDQGEETAAGSN